MRVSSVAVLAGAAAASFLACAIVWNFRRRKNDGDHDDADGASSTTEQSSSQQENTTTATRIRNIKLPMHLERELYKEDRRQQMMPHLTMKSPMYDNIFLHDAAGTLLTTISSKKAAWYLKKNLGVWISDKHLQLLFQPKQAPNNKNAQQVQYNITEKQNVCVVCGADKNFMRHYVVPYCYRSLLPSSFKTHLPHDVVLTCAVCHVVTEQHSQRRMRLIEQALRGADPDNTAVPVLVDGRLQNVRSGANALLKWKNQLPAARVREYEALLRDWFSLADDDDDAVDDPAEITVEQLQTASEIESRLPNPKYISGPALVMESLKGGSDSDDNIILIAAFVREWRAHFLDTMQPQYLPAGWSIESPVQCD